MRWDDSLKPLFSNYLEKDSEGINDINQRIEAGLIGSTGIKLQEFFMQAAKNVFHVKQKNEFVNQNNLEKNRHNRKIWFDNECKKLKSEVRKLGSHKGKDRQNSILRVKYQEILKQYKQKSRSNTLRA